jgi:hypothetical protein
MVRSAVPRLPIRLPKLNALASMLAVLNQRHTKYDRSVFRIDGHRTVGHHVGSRRVRSFKRNSCLRKCGAPGFHSNPSLLFLQIAFSRHLYAKWRVTLLFGFVAIEADRRSRPFEPFIGFLNWIFRYLLTWALRAESIRQAETKHKTQNSPNATRHKPATVAVNDFNSSSAPPRTHAIARSIHTYRHALLLVMLHKTN